MTPSILESAFIRELVRQIRARDRFGTQDALSDEALLAPYIVTPEARRAIPIVGDPDEETVARVEAFYQAIAALIESECGQMATALVHLSHEGFGRVLITVGKLVVLDRTLRDVHRFGFESLEKMKTESDKLLAVALEIISQYPKAAGLGSERE
ncbi:MAG: NifX-associated nitrogen fixation protein [Hydrogenophilus sp.]|nr:NifX-associated nitrogen fixation protein [Hydrogenophilus sp.]